MTPTGLANTWALPPDPGPARRELQALLEESHWPGDVDAVVLAVHEAMINAERHGGGATSATAEVTGSSITVEVRDQGPGFDLKSQAQQRPDALAERGRGLWLISQIAQSWDVRRRGRETCLRLRFQA
ncbi:MAG: ATP-binding protein [Acidimicrobiales bacterium]|nr:ATP-binding protein [Actinomycetota bacterium]